MLASMLTFMLASFSASNELHVAVETDLMILRSHAVVVVLHLKGVKGQCAFEGKKKKFGTWLTLTGSHLWETVL